MIVKRDGFALLQQAVQGPKYLESTKAKVKGAAESNSRYGNIWKFPNQGISSQLQRTPEKATTYTLQTLQPAYVTPPHRHQPHPAYPSSPMVYKPNAYHPDAIGNGQAYNSSAALTPPYRNNSIISMDGSVNSQCDNVPRNYQQATQIDYEAPAQGGYVWPGSVISSNTYVYPTLPNDAAYPTIINHQQHVMEIQRQEHERWVQQVNEKAEREKLALAEERRQREIALTKGKNDLVQAAAGDQGTEDMRKVMANYLAVDGMNISS